MVNAPVLAVVYFIKLENGEACGWDMMLQQQT